MLHLSNLYHLIYATAAWFLIQAYLGNSRATKFRMVMRLLQIMPLLFALDLVAGFILIDRWYGSNQSAVWISRSAIIFPMIFIVSAWRIFKGKQEKDPK
jgi:hypothetical protein